MLHHLYFEPHGDFVRFTAILVSRSMMNLQEAALRQGATQSEYESMVGELRSLSSLHFSRLVGSFGQPVGSIVCEGDAKDEQELTHEPV